MAVGAIFFDFFADTALFTGKIPPPAGIAPVYRHPTDRNGLKG
jgi:hypothetical protein